jgi:acid phosphatase family membrane protein YuiD
MFYHILLLPIAAGFAAQFIKFFIRSNHTKMKIKNLTAYSGMPSGHSAMIVSLATIIGLEEGYNSPLFAISIILAIIVIRDALGIRRYLGQHGKVLNILLKDLENDQVLEYKYPHLLERIGHTPLQVIAGSLLGFTISVIGFYLLK